MEKGRRKVRKEEVSGEGGSDIVPVI